RGETVDEVVGAVQVMRSKVTPIEAPPGAIDCCGTGGDASGTYNISTAVSFVLAAHGVPVAKHGNRNLSSKSGAADVLAALGVNLDAPMDVVQACLDEVGVCFLFAIRHHGAMRHVGPSRAEMGTRTIFNLLGPLSNPAGVRRQLVGVFDGNWAAPMAEVLGRLGTERAMVVHGSDGLDEMTTTGPTHIAELKGGKVTEYDITPSDVGLAISNKDDLKGGDASENADALRAVLAGDAGAYRDIVLLNAAGALMVADRCDTLSDGVALAAQAIKSGKAAHKLEMLVEVSNRE
ncbi:MAG: anthranilate phosphoribosyltransferase, partial [Pseudomonadota bacterium]